MNVFLCLSVLCILCGGSLAANTDDSVLSAGFASPPAEARPLAWWHWINGNITKDGIRADLEDMKRVGIGGAQMLDVSIYLPPGPIRYGTDAWHEHAQFAIRTAAELGLELDLMNSPGWSGSGGPWITPERGMKRYVWTETEVAGGAPVSVQLKQPKAKLDFYRDVAVLAIPAGSMATVKDGPSLKAVAAVKLDPQANPIAPDRVLVLTKSMNATGLLSCELPAGRWTILRFGYTTTGSVNHPAQPEGHGQECDKMDAGIVAFQFEQSLGRIIREAGPLAGKSLRGVLFDSFEGGYQNWCATLPQDFQQRRGYDIIPWLPVLTGRTVGSAEQSEAFLRDFRGVVAELIAERYLGTMRRLANARGLKVYAEAQGGPLNPFLCNEHTDVPMNEFWMPDARPRFANMKHIASIASLLDRRVVGAEAFTAKPEDGRWLATPASMKAVGDCAFVAGINRFIFHTYVHQPFSDIAPGFTLGRYGTHFGRLNTWWPIASAWMSYLARCQFLLQQGSTVADVCFLTDDSPNFLLSTASLALPRGYDYEVCHSRHLDRAAKRPYRVVVLPEKWSADTETLRRLLEFAETGVALIGKPPSAPAGLLTPLGEWRGLVGKLAARLQPRETLQRVLPKPDVFYVTEPADADVLYIHRKTADADIYFLSNQSGAPVTLRAEFRAANGRAAEMWDAVTGRISPASGAIHLDAAGSVFVVFRQPPVGQTLLSGQNPEGQTRVSGLRIAGPWRVRFQPGRGAPAEIRMDQPSDWSKHSDPGVRFFSGIATYSTTFDLPTTADRYVLQLGKVCDVADVKVNGRNAGIAWTPPFELDVTNLVHAGWNTLEIAVANRWVNRLIGDESLPPDARYEFTGSKFTIGRLAELPAWLGNRDLTRRRERVTFATWHFYEKDSPLLESGLIGPARIESRGSSPSQEK
jgi:hypothetical protein